MSAFFGRPLDDNITKARLINFKFDDVDDTLCPNTDPGIERSIDYFNIWHVDKDGVSIGNSAISENLNGYDRNNDSNKCLTDEPVALLASRGKCSFEAKAIQALSNTPFLLDRNGYQNCSIDVSYLIIYDKQLQELEKEQIHENNDNHTISSPRLVRMSSTDNSVKDDMPISLLFVSYETGMALKQKIEDLSERNGISNDADFFDERGLILTLNAGGVESKRRRHHTRKSFNNDWTDDSNNDDTNPGGSIDDFYDDDYPAEDPGRILFEQMVTAMSLMFSFIFCIGCLMLCCCHPDDDGGDGWFTVHFDRRGFVFGRPDDGESVARLLTEEEVLAFPEVEFGEKRNSDDGHNSNSNDLEVGQNENMDIGISSTPVETTECCLSSETPLIGNENLGNTDHETTSCPKRPLPLQHRTCSPLNNDSLSFNAMCSICLEEYDHREKLRMLPCQHLFHTECIIPWLTERFPNCPLCKAQIIPYQTEDGNEHLNDDDEVIAVRDYDDANNTNEGEVEMGDRLIEVNDEGSSVPSWRNFLFGSLSRPSAPSITAITGNADRDLSIHYSEGEESSEENVMSALSTPLLQDSRSPSTNSASELTLL